MNRGCLVSMVAVGTIVLTLGFLALLGFLIWLNMDTFMSA